jgi:glycosyltransferase involved in cell wall biosynthesis
MSRGRIAIVYPRTNVDSVPCLVGAADALARAAYDVDLLVSTRAGAPLPCFATDRVHIVSIGTDASSGPPAALRGRLRFLPPSARASLARSYALARRLQPRRHTVPLRQYDCVIGVDPDGLTFANEIARGAAVIYFSLELLLTDDLQTPAERALKARERTLSREAALVVIQDEARGRLLAQDNDIPLQRMVFVPNSPPGPVRRMANRYWHARFELPASARVVLHAGSLGAWTGIEQLVVSTTVWPEPWVLVVHTRYDAESSPYVERLRTQADPRRVHFSLQPVPRQAYDVLIDGADVGVGFYLPSRDSAFTQRNIETIGLSSGKLAYFLRAGLPVIVNDATSIAPRIVEAGCGVAVADAYGVADALVRIAANYARFSTRACDFFNTELDFDRAFERVISRLQELLVAA